MNTRRTYRWLLGAAVLSAVLLAVSVTPAHAAGGPAGSAASCMGLESITNGPAPGGRPGVGLNEDSRPGVLNLFQDLVDLHNTIYDDDLTLGEALAIFATLGVDEHEACDTAFLDALGLL